MDPEAEKKNKLKGYQGTAWRARVSLTFDLYKQNLQIYGTSTH